MDSIKRIFTKETKQVFTYAAGMFKWFALATLTGLGCGLLGTAFHVAVGHVTALREANAWLIWCLPVFGLMIVGLYKLLHTEGMGTNDVIETVKTGKPLTIKLVPAIFIGTVLTHLGGGSAGREGAALQMGGAIGVGAGRLLRLRDHDIRTAAICGMAAFFAALFGTPLAATFFAMMVINVGVVFYSAFIPCFTASLVAYGVSLILGVEPTRFSITAPGFEFAMTLRVLALGVGCAIVTIIFCELLEHCEKQVARRIPNPWLRAAAGGVVIIGLTYLFGQGRYNGAGMDVITAAVQSGSIQPFDWALKLIFTVLTLSAGFRGGEVVPSFFIGAAFGCFLGPLLGIDAGFAAALGMIAVFCGATNCMIGSLFLAFELFNGEGMLYFGVACGVSYVLSGYSGLYSSQTFLTSKLESEYIDSVHEGLHNGGGEE